MTATDADDRRWMLRALRQASRAAGTTWPNPGVGCVLVRDGVVLGEGRTAPGSGGQEHAEAAALRRCRELGHDPAGATAYVTLAPCTRRSVAGGHQACATQLIAARPARVVIATADPSQADAVAAFAAAGIPVTVGVREAAARHVHGGFLSRITAKRPRFTGKWAQTLDGFLATGTGHSGWISAPEALALSRRRRRAFDAILIGAGTARADDPALLTTHPRRAGPLRIVVSAAGDLADESRLLTTLDRTPLLVVHGVGADPARLLAWGAQAQALDDPHDVVRLARLLGGWGLNEVLVEGGAGIHGAFLRAGLYDRLELYQGATTLGGGLPVARGEGVPTIPDGIHWHPEEPPRLLGTTVLTRWRH